MFSQIFVLLVLLLILLLLVSTTLNPSKILLLACGALFVSGVLPAELALSGFSNIGVFTIAALYVVVGGLRESGATQLLKRFLVGQPKSQSHVINRILPVTVMLSAFLNNTPVVAMFTTLVQALSKRHLIQISNILIPISYASILGGLCTLIGSSTNLVIDGMVKAQGLPGFSLFELSYLGGPIAVTGLIYLKFIAPYLLPNRESAIEQFEKVKEYTVEMIIQDHSELVHCSIQDAGLRNLSGLFLIEIEREGKILSAVSPNIILEKNDRLVFAGVPESVLELNNIYGLVLANDQRFKLEGNRSDRHLFEAVLSPSNYMIGKTIKNSRFRHHYNAVVLSVSRHGERLIGQLGQLRMKAGDTLLIEAQKVFLMRYRNSGDFLLVSKLSDPPHRDEGKAITALFIFLMMIAFSAIGFLSILESVIAAAGVMLLSKCISFEDAGKSIDYNVLLGIACAFSLGAAVTHVGLADVISANILVFIDTPLSALVFIYIITVLLTELMTNNAAAIIMLPIALSTAQVFSVQYEPFAVAVMVSASASFMTPMGYQTNLMVMGPGGYHVRDYLKVGAPLSVIVAVMSFVLIPVIWPL